MYQIGDFVVYGKQGVCQVENISFSIESGEDIRKLYYTLKPVHDNMITHTPVDTKVFIRPLTPLKEVKRLIIGIRYIEATSIEQENKQELSRCYLKFIDDNNCYSLLQLIKNVYEKERQRLLQNKKLGKIDIKFKQEAENLICQEFSQVLQLPKEHIAQYLNRCMHHSI